MKPCDKPLHWDAQLYSLCRPQTVLVPIVLVLVVTCNDIKEENIFTCNDIKTGTQEHRNTGTHFTLKTTI
jgi:hypothetical protein